VFFVRVLPTEKSIPQALKRGHFQKLNGTTEETAEKVETVTSAPKGAID